MEPEQTERILLMSDLLTGTVVLTHSLTDYVVRDTEPVQAEREGEGRPAKTKGERAGEGGRGREGGREGGWERMGGSLTHVYDFRPSYLPTHPSALLAYSLTYLLTYS